MIYRTALMAALALALGTTGIPAQAAEGADTPASAAPKPTADTKDPGKTATEAVTNPSVPATKGVDGSRVSPDGHGAGGQPTSGSAPVR
jgi:hypothetical protein